MSGSYLLIIKGPHQGHRFPIGTYNTCGPSEEFDICLPSIKATMGISCGSKPMILVHSGTVFVNGRIVFGTTSFKEGDILSTGKTAFVYIKGIPQTKKSHGILIILDGPGAGIIFDLKRHNVFGSSLKCDVTLMHSQLQPQHGEIAYNQDTTIITPLNGDILVNGQPIFKAKTLQHGDMITCADIMFLFGLTTEVYPQSDLHSFYNIYDVLHGLLSCESSLYNIKKIFDLDKTINKTSIQDVFSSVSKALNAEDSALLCYKEGKLQTIIPNKQKLNKALLAHAAKNQKGITEERDLKSYFYLPLHNQQQQILGCAYFSSPDGITGKHKRIFAMALVFLITNALEKNKPRPLFIDFPPYDWQEVKIFICAPPKLDEAQQKLYNFVMPKLRHWCKKWKLQLADKYYHCKDRTWDITVAKMWRDFSDQGYPIFIFLFDSAPSFSIDFPEILTSQYQTPPIVFSYDVNAKELAHTVEQNLKTTISDVFQKRLEYIWQKTSHNTWEKHQHLQQAFIEQSSSSYIRLVPLLQKLEEYVNSDLDTIMVVYGQQGSGKTTLLANFCKVFQNRYLIIPHFCHISSIKESALFFLKLLCRELGFSCDLEKANIEQLQSFLAKTKPSKKTVIVIDDLDTHLFLEYIPHHIFKTIISTDIASFALSANKLKINTLRPTETKIITQYNTNFVDAKVLQYLLKRGPYFTPLRLHFFLKMLKNPFIENAKELVVAFSKNLEFQYFLKHLEKKYNQKHPGVFKSLLSLVQQEITAKELQENMLEWDEEEIYKIMLYDLEDFVKLQKDNWKIISRGFAKAVKKFAKLERPEI